MKQKNFPNFQINIISFEYYNQMIQRLRVKSVLSLIQAKSKIFHFRTPQIYPSLFQLYVIARINYFSTQKQLNQADSDYLKTLNDQAETYYSKGQFSNARQALKKAADLLRKVHGEKNLDYSRVLNNIGITYKIERKFNEAIEYLNKSNEILNSIQGNFENEKAYSNGQLGQIYYLQKDYEKAYNLLNVSTSTLYKNKLETLELVSLYDILGNISKARENFQEASEAFKRSIEIFKKLPNRQPSESVHTLNQLGKCYMKLSKLNQALATYQQVYEIQNSRQTKESLATASALINIAMIYRLMKNFQDYAAYFEKGMNMAQKIQGHNHIDIGPLAQSLGQAYFQRDQIQKALPLLQKCLEIIDKANKKESIRLNYGTILTMIGHIHRRKQNYKESLRLFEQAYQIFFSDNKISQYTASLLNSIGEIHALQKNFNNSLQNFLKSLNILEQINGKDSEKNFKIYYNIIAIYQMMGNTQQMEKYLKIVEKFKTPQKS